MRSLTADRKVLSAQGLTQSHTQRAESANPEQFTACVSRFPKEYRKDFEIPPVDRTKRDSSTWFASGVGILPDPLSQEHIGRRVDMPEEQKEFVRAKIKEDPK